MSSGPASRLTSSRRSGTRRPGQVMLTARPGGERVSGGAELGSGTERFTTTDVSVLFSYVADIWRAAADLDWSAQAGTVEWSCLQTVDHAVDCVWGPAFFLAARRRDRYPDLGVDMALGPEADAARLGSSSRWRSPPASCARSSTTRPRTFELSSSVGRRSSSQRLRTSHRARPWS